MVSNQALFTQIEDKDEGGLLGSWSFSQIAWHLSAKQEVTFARGLSLPPGQPTFLVG